MTYTKFTVKVLNMVGDSCQHFAHSKIYDASEFEISMAIPTIISVVLSKKKDTPVAVYPINYTIIEYHD